ncbi:MAG: hypothetical protein ACK5OI_14560 [Curvibacter sp.]
MRIGLFGLDKLHNPDRSVKLLAAVKFARREGTQLFLAPMRHKIPPSL